MGYLQRVFRGITRPFFAFAVYLPMVLLVGVWLRGDPETRYRREYAKLPLVARAGFSVVTAALIVAGFIAFLVPA
jgi:hypothetical protein